MRRPPLPLPPFRAMLVLSLLLSPAAARAADPPVPWEQILGPAQGEVPPPVPGAVTWRTDVSAALAEAVRVGRPVFVTMRCLPCKQCSGFDKAVLEGGAELDPLLRQFVTVRLTDVQDVDLRLLPMAGFQDLDLSWWGWFLSPHGHVYGVFGGRDKVSDETRISPAALAATMRRVLAHHYDPRRAGWKVYGPLPDRFGVAPTPKTLPGYAAWKAGANQHVKGQTCLHCHQVAEVLRQPAVDGKTFDKRRDFNVWPLPENVGLTLDRDHGLKVKSVAKDSPADRAGLKAGDELAAAGGRRLFSQADLRGVLHRGPAGAGAVDVWWRRDGKPARGSLALPDGWRAPLPGELDWRMSVSQGNVGAGPGFFPLAPGASDRKARGIAADTMAIKPYTGPNPTGAVWKAGLRKDHVITAVGGESPNVTGRAFLVWFRLRYDPGDRVTFTVVDASGKSEQVTFALVAHEE